MKSDNTYLTCEKNWVFFTLMTIAGFFGAYTYLLRGNVFCNAQTGNVVLLGMALGAGKWTEALYYLIPISAYLLGAFASELLPNPVKHVFPIRWDTLLIAIEMIVVAFLGFLPESAPVQISQVAINFIASMQYNTFRRARVDPLCHESHPADRRGTCKGNQAFPRPGKSTPKKIKETLPHVGMLPLRCNRRHGIL